MSERILDISAFGREGDGIGFLDRDGGRVTVIVPGAVPGDRVRVRLPDEARPLQTAELLAIETPSPQRRQPPCRHFGTCGGCMAQHLTVDAYLAWKRDWIAGLLAANNIVTELLPIVPVAEGTRRRAVLSARRTKKTVQLGYYRARSHDLVDIAECPILVPAIAGALNGLRELVRPLLSRSGVARLTILSTLGGLDVAVEGAKAVEGAAEREHLAQLCQTHHVARLTVDREPFFERERPRIRIGDTIVSPPPAAFLQASAESQQAMIERVLALIPETADRVADLYSGVGTFALPLAKRHKVLAAESDKGHLAALRRGFDEAAGALKPVEALLRDLYLMPLSALELRGFDAAVFDPPRGGAEQQARELAQSDVADVIAVSCDPPTFIRDAKILLDGGYKLLSVTPFDQFLYSEHLEVIGHFRR
jgi:23S rRNA (uracil1939-C5)-methyltransferase